MINPAMLPIERKEYEDTLILVKSITCNHLPVTLRSMPMRRKLRSLFNTDPIAALYYNSNCPEDIALLKYPTVNACLFATLKKLAWICRRTKTFIRELIIASPIIKMMPELLVDADLLDRKIEEACIAQKTIANRSPHGNIKRPLKERIIYMLSRKGDMTPYEMCQILRHQHRIKMPKLIATLTVLQQAGVLDITPDGKYGVRVF